MYTISSFSPDTTVYSSLSMPSSLRRLGTIKLLILATVIPIMILTIINPMWICIFMKYPHVHHYNIKTPVNAEVHHEGNYHVPNNVHNKNVVSHVKPQTHTHTKSYKGGIKVTQEMIDVIVASKDGHRIEELETTITVIENVPPSSHHHKQNHKHNFNNFKAHQAHQVHQAHKAQKAQISNNDEPIIDKIRERLFRNRYSCAYVALSVILLCAVTVCGILCLSSDNRKAYESVNDVNDDDDENRCQSTSHHYVRIEDDDQVKTNNESFEKSDENNDIENKTDLQIISISDSHNINTLASSPPPYSPSNTNPESIFISTSHENIQQRTDEN